MSCQNALPADLLIYSNKQPKCFQKLIRRLCNINSSASRTFAFSVTRHILIQYLEIRKIYHITTQKSLQLSHHLYF